MVSDPTSRVVRRARWNGLGAGDPVVVDTPKERRHHYEFVALAEHGTSGESWVEVRGGAAGERRDRSFRPELIRYAITKCGKVVAGSAVVDAPRLDFFQEPNVSKGKRRLTR